MFLSRPDILKHLKRKRDPLRFDPAIQEDRVRQVSIDLVLGRKFTTFKKGDDRPDHIASIFMNPSIWGSQELWKHEIKDSHTLEAGEFVLAQTLESVSVPASLIGFVEGRSSYARIGLSVHVTAPKIDPGFNGHITLEMRNFGDVPIKLRAGIDKPAQLLLARISTPLKRGDLYGASPDDIFQHQQETMPKSRRT